MFLLRRILVAFLTVLIFFPTPIYSSVKDASNSILTPPRNPNVSRRNMRKRRKLKRKRKRRKRKRNRGRHIKTIKTRQIVKQKKRQALARKKVLDKKKKEALKQRNNKKI